MLAAVVEELTFQLRHQQLLRLVDWVEVVKVVSVILDQTIIHTMEMKDLLVTVEIEESRTPVAVVEEDQDFKLLAVMVVLVSLFSNIR